jgi:hypothetical protein
MFGIADRLNKTVAELEQMPYNELIEWVAYLEIINGRERKT